MRDIYARLIVGAIVVCLLAIGALIVLGIINQPWLVAQVVGGGAALCAVCYGIGTWLERRL